MVGYNAVTIVGGDGDHYNVWCPEHIEEHHPNPVEITVPHLEGEPALRDMAIRLIRSEAGVGG